MATINANICIRRDTAANWTSNNPTLLTGEMCYETDTGKFKVGTGTTWTATSYGNVNFKASGTGAVTRTINSKLEDVLNIKDYGAIGDGTLHTVAEWIPSRYANLAAVQVDYPFVTGTGYSIDLAAINKAILLLSQSRVSPPDSPPSETNAIGLSGWGFGKVYIPRGDYVTNDKIYVSNGTVGNTTPTSAIGLCFQGDGSYASNIIYNQSTGDMCHLNICLNVYFADLSFINITSAARGTWTSNAFRINPVGGGKLFQMDRCYMRNFNIGINLEGTVNNDTTRINNCFCEGQNTWLFCRNSQAIINEINSCSIYRSFNKVFDLDGCGYTTVSNCDIIVPGIILHLAGSEPSSGLSGLASQYTLINCKFEFWNEFPIGPALPNDLGTTQIVVTQSAQQSFAFIRMIGCGIQGGTPNPSVFQFDLQGGTTTLDINGGAWGDTNGVLKIRTKTWLGRGQAFRHRNWVKFENCATTPSKTITRLAEAGQDGWSQQMPVIWKNCSSTPDICMYGPGTDQNLSTPVGGGLDRNQNSMNNNGNIAFGHASVFPINTEHAFPTDGQRVLVQKIYAIASKGSGGGISILRLEAFKDAAFTQQIGSTTTKTADFAAPFVMEITVPAGTFVTDGVWVRMWHDNPNNLYAGMVYVDTVSV